MGGWTDVGIPGIKAEAEDGLNVLVKSIQGHSQIRTRDKIEYKADAGGSHSPIPHMTATATP